jgi:hypothetical protein
MYKNPNVDKSEIKKSVEVMKTNGMKLEIEKLKIIDKVFNMKYLQNDDKIDIDLIGQILRANKYGKLNLTNQRSFSSIFDVSFSSDGKSLLIFSNNNDYHNKNSSFLDVYDRKPVLKYKNGSIFSSPINSYVIFEEFIIYAYSRYIRIYKKDSNLNKYVAYLKKPATHFKCITMCADNDNIFLMNQNYEVDYYNWTLNKVKTVGQMKNVNEPFYFNDVQQFDIKNKKFYLRRSNKIDIINKKDGKLFKTIDINSYKFIINGKQLISFCDNDIHKYQIENCSLISKTSLHSIPDGYKLLDFKNNIYLLISKNKNNLYYLSF